MINALQFLEGKNKVCNTFTPTNCEGCPFRFEENPCLEATCGLEDGYWTDEERIKTLEDWLVAHPIRTNQNKFIEVFGFDPGVLRLGNDSWYEVWLNKAYKEPEHED